MSKLRERARQLAKINLDAEKEYVGCEDLLREWMLEFYYGVKVKKVIPQMLELYQYCIENDHTSYKKAVWYGDDDVAVWVEFIKDQPSHKDQKVLILRDVVTGRDANTFIFIYNNLPSVLDIDFESLMCTSVWDEEVKKSERFWNDHRDIEQPNLQTLRDYNFKFGYQDCRDEGHCFNYRGRDETCESPHANEGSLQQSISELSFAHHNIIEE